MFSCFLALSAVAELRVALISLDDSSRNDADLALAELSSETDILFLERAEMEKIRREIRLSVLSDFIPEPRLLENTQLFILLKGRQIIAFDSRTGVRLVDCEFDGIAELTSAIKATVEKQRCFSSGTLRKISVMPLVPAHLDEMQEKFARQAETLMLQRLCARADVVLLERRHLLYLLNEPNSVERKLTEQLFAGAVVMKPTAVPNSPKGILLKLHFYSSDGRRSLEECEIAVDSLNKSVEGAFDNLAIPEDSSEDKKGEANQFIREAWFAFSHGMGQDAMSSGASAVALDDGYAQELARIAFLFAGQMFAQSSYQPDSRKIDLALDNMRLGATLTETHNGYSREGKQAAYMILWSLNRHCFERFSAQRQKAFMETMERLVVLRKRQLDFELLPLIKSEGPRWPNGIFRVETMAQYAQELHWFCNMSWDFSLWEKYVYPEMERFIDAFDDMLPEIERFNRMSWREKFPIVSNPDIKKLRSRENRQFGGMNMMNITFRFYLNENVDSSKMSAHEHAFREKVFRRMMSSKYFPLAMNGLEIFMRLKFGEIDFGYKPMNDERRKAAAAYYAELKRILNNVSPFFLGPHYYHIRAATEDFITERIEIQDIAVKRLNWSAPFEGYFLNGYQKWTEKTARNVYERFGVWEEECVAAIEKENAPEGDKVYRVQRTKDYFARMQGQLEKQFGFEGNGRLKTPVVNPYSHVYSPFVDDKTIQKVIYAGCEKRFLYTFVKSKDNALSLQKIDLDSPQIAWWISSLQMPEQWCECVFGAVLDDCCAAFVVKESLAWICVFPKDGGNAEIFPVKNYREGRHGFGYTAFCGGGDSLFVSFDGSSNLAGKLVQYNVRSREAKVIASTIDRSVRWPLQGIDSPYAIKPLICDAANKRIVTLLNEKPHPNTGNLHYDMSFWAYYWETGEWKVISKYLPLSQTGTGVFCKLIDGVLWLSCDYGSGRINENGNFQPVFLIGGNRHLSDVAIQYGSPFFKNVIVDKSKIKHPEPMYNDLMDWDLFFTACDGKIFWGQNAIMLIDEQKFFRVNDNFRIVQCIENKYCIGWHRQSEFQIRVLKPIDDWQKTNEAHAVMKF